MFAEEIFSTVNVPSVQALLGNPARIYPHAIAPPTPPRPYAVFSTVGGIPSVCLDDPPTHDDERIQFSVWGETVASVQPVALALRDVLEVAGNLNGYGDLGQDTETKLFGIFIDWQRFRGR